MTINEREARGREVIEGRLFPVGRRMTVLACGAIHPHVAVVLPMAADARRRGLDVLLIDMAARTRHFIVRSGKGETAKELVVVEGVRPFSLAVAVGADPAEIAQMSIVVEMA